VTSLRHNRKCNSQRIRDAGGGTNVSYVATASRMKVRDVSS
jgi:hypothetical protein